jgi:HEAT repeat protein
VDAGQNVPDNNSKKGRRRVGWVFLIVFIAFSVTALLILQRPRNFYWCGRSLSLTLQSLVPGGPFSNDKIWVRSGWARPTGEFIHGELYGVKLGNILLRLDITYNPIAAIKEKLPATVPGLVEALGSKDPLVNKCAGEVLVRMGADAQSAFPLLFEHYRQGHDEGEWIILELAKRAGTSSVPHLLLALKDPDPKVRQKAAEALGELGSRASPAVQMLTEALHDPDPGTIITVALSLRKIEQRNHGEVQSLVTLLAHTNTEVRAGAAYVLGEFGPDAALAVQPLLSLLDRDDPNTAGLVSRTLGLIGPAAKPAIPRMIALLSSKTNAENQMLTMEALGHFGENAEAAIPKLLELAQQDPEQTFGAVSALSQIGTNALPGLIELYSDGDHRQRSCVERAFLKLGTNAAPAVAAVFRALTDEPTRGVAHAALILGSIGEPARIAIPRLVELTQIDDPNVRLRSAEALWRLDRQTNTVLPVLIHELESWATEPNALISRKGDEFGQSQEEIAAGILREIGPSAHEAIPLLQVMLRSSFNELKESAAAALSEIQGAGKRM